MKTFPSAILAAVLALCLCPALAFAQTGDSLASGEAQENVKQVELSLIQSGAYVVPSPSQLAVQASSPFSADQEKELKSRFTEACKNVDQNVNISSLNITSSSAADARMVEILSEVVNSNPDFFYVNGGLSFSTVSSRYATITIVYDYTRAQVATMKEQYNAGLNEALSWVPENATDVQKAKAIHDWLVRSCVYNNAAASSAGPAAYGSKNPWNAYGAFVDKKPVCQGYSLAFSAAMSRLGIASTYVGQEIPGYGGHGWNRVKIDGSWYNLDVTFDDPIVNGADRGFTPTPYTDYFLKSDAWFKSHPEKRGFHTSWTPAGEPATDTRYDNYKISDWPTYKAPASESSDPSGSGDQGGSGVDPSPGQTDGDNPQNGEAKTPTNTKKTIALTVKGKTIKVKLKNLKKKKKLTFASTKAFSVSNAIGSISYKKKFGQSKIAIAKDGKVTVKKGLKKGKYGVVVSIDTTGSLTYTPQSATATVTIQVK